MAKEWYYTKDGEQQGPVTSKQLKQLADVGELQPTDLVWTEGKNEWKPASGIKGLFQATSQPKATKPPPPPISEPSTNSMDQILAKESFGDWYQERLGKQPIVIQLMLWLFSGYVWIPMWWLVTTSSQRPGLADSGLAAVNGPSKIPFWENAAIIVLALVCFFPVGLFLVWKTSWDNRKKWIYTGGFMVFFLFGVVMVQMNKQEAAMKTAEANALWEQGEQEKAIMLYQELAKDQFYIPEEQRPILFGRLIDHAAKNRNTTEIRRLLDRAVGFTPDCRSDEAKRFVAQIEAKRKAEAAKKENEKKSKKAISQVVTLSGSDIVDFMDNTKKYKGKVIRMILTMPSGFLRSGGSIAFYDFVGTSKLDVRINVAPSSVDTLAEFNSLDDLPNAELFSKLEVTFLCEEGSLNYGNRAIRIVRP